MITIQSQLTLALEELEKELKRSEPSDARLEYWYKKIVVLEQYL